MHGERIERIRDVMTPEPITVTPIMTIEQAARRMRDAGIGNVVVLNGGQITGHPHRPRHRGAGGRGGVAGGDAGGRGGQPRSSTTIGPDESIDEAVALMRERSIRRLPVVERGRPVGIVSLGDLALERNPESALGEISAAPPND